MRTVCPAPILATTSTASHSSWQRQGRHRAKDYNPGLMKVAADLLCRGGEEVLANTSRPVYRVQRPDQIMDRGGPGKPIAGGTEATPASWLRTTRGRVSWQV